MLAIASLSLGGKRKFIFRSTSDPTERFAISLSPGSLLLGCQESYEHGLPLDKHCSEARLNLTFRKYGWEQHEGAVRRLDEIAQAFE
ncbi:MAG: alpha-ketoglutarate-dependent dioxygenase AlkB [Synechococcus sp.]